jgi:anti-sigma regulatory factor (Ser/Thr protein kinase)
MSTLGIPPATRHADRTPEGAFAPTPGLQDLVVTVPAVAASLRRVRRALRTWLGRQGWCDAAAEDVELAVGEALANAVDHAYPAGEPGEVRLHAWVSVDPRTRSRRVVSTVTDRGSWDPAHRGTELAEHRGRGMLLMRRVMAHLHVQRSARGTGVLLVSPDQPPVPI